MFKENTINFILNNGTKKEIKNLILLGVVEGNWKSKVSFLIDAVMPVIMKDREKKEINNNEFLDYFKYEKLIELAFNQKDNQDNLIMKYLESLPDFYALKKYKYVNKHDISKFLNNDTLEQHNYITMHIFMSLKSKILLS